MVCPVAYNTKHQTNVSSHLSCQAEYFTYTETLVKSLMPENAHTRSAVTMAVKTAFYYCDS